MDDARIAVETGVDGVDVVIGTSSFLREHSHGKDMTYILKVGCFSHVGQPFSLLTRFRSWSLHPFCLSLALAPLPPSLLTSHFSHPPSLSLRSSSRNLMMCTCMIRMPILLHTDRHRSHWIRKVQEYRNPIFIRRFLPIRFGWFTFNLSSSRQDWCQSCRYRRYCWMR